MDYSSDFSSDLLQCVPLNVVEKYVKTLIYDFPDSLHVYSFIRVLLKWKRMRPNLDVSFLSPEGDPRNGIILSWIRNECFLGTIYVKDDNSKEKLKAALETAKKLSFLKSNSAIFTCMTEKSFKTIKELFSSPDWCIDHDVVFWLPWYVAREFKVNLPEDVEIRELEGENAKQINSGWSHRHPGSEQFLRETIELNLGFGAFKGEKLLSWILVCFFGGIGILQTEEEEKIQGCGRVVIEAITKKLGDMQLDVHLSVDDQSSSTIAFFKALGFRHAFNCIWATRGARKEKNKFK